KVSDALGVGAPEGDALHASSERAQAVRSAVQSCIDALSAHVAILDEAGNILAVNERWRNFAGSNQLISPRHAVGDNYLAVCDGSAAAGDATAANVAAGIRDRKSTRLNSSHLG